jgi:hypothetical protein
MYVRREWDKKRLPFRGGVRGGVVRSCRSRARKNGRTGTHRYEAGRCLWVGSLDDKARLLGGEGMMLTAWGRKTKPEKV